MQGYVKIHRQLLRDEFFFNPITEKYNYLEIGRWVAMLLSVNHSAKTVNLKVMKVKLKPGQSCKGLKTWANILGMSLSSLRTWFGYLKLDGKIKLESVSKNGKNVTTKLTILNWDKWQSNESMLSRNKETYLDSDLEGIKITNQTTNDTTNQTTTDIQTRMIKNDKEKNKNICEVNFTAEDKNDNPEPKETLKKKEKSSAQKEKEISIKKARIEVIEYLNEKGNFNYGPDTKSSKKVDAILKAKITVEQIKAVLDYKIKEWNNPEMRKWLKPSTLFTMKFYDYLGQLPTKTKNVATNDRTDVIWASYNKQYKPNTEYPGTDGKIYVFDSEMNFIDILSGDRKPIGRMTVNSHYDKWKSINKNKGKK